MTPDVIGVAIVAIVVILVLLAIVVLFRASWRVAEPDEALIISGLRASGRQDGAGESMGFNIVTGRGALILPGVTKVRRLSLASASRRSASTFGGSSSTRSVMTSVRLPMPRAVSWIGLPRSSKRRSRTCSSAISGRSPDR